MMCNRTGERIRKMEKPFPITSVCRDDVIGVEFGKGRKWKKIAESLTDSEMEWIARKMADDYCNQLFWDSLRVMVEAVVERRVK